MPRPSRVARLWSIVSSVGRHAYAVLGEIRRRSIGGRGNTTNLGGILCGRDAARDGLGKMKLELQPMNFSSIDHSTVLTRRRAIWLLGATLAVPVRSAFANPSAILVHNDPNCGCCTRWVRHLEQAGFAVMVEETAGLAGVRKRLGVPVELASCHTAIIQGYVIEGHVPASAVRRLLEQRPTAVGLAVPGMPAGSPRHGGRSASKIRGGCFQRCRS